VFESVENCSKIVQSKTISAVAAKKAAKTAVQMLQSLRDDVKFNELYDDHMRTAASLNVDEPKVGRKVRPPRCLDDGSAGYHPPTCRERKERKGLALPLFRSFRRLCNSSCSLDRSTLYGMILNATLWTTGALKFFWISSGSVGSMDIDHCSCNAAQVICSVRVLVIIYFSE